MGVVARDETKSLFVKVAFRNIIYGKKINDVRCWDLNWDLKLIL